MSEQIGVVVGTEERTGRCKNGHEQTVSVTLFWNPWGLPDGYFPGCACHECPETVYALSRYEMERGN